MGVRALPALYMAATPMYFWLISDISVKKYSIA